MSTQPRAFVASSTPPARIYEIQIDDRLHPILPAPVAMFTRDAVRKYGVLPLAMHQNRQTAISKLRQCLQKQRPAIMQISQSLFHKNNQTSAVPAQNDGLPCRVIQRKFGSDRSCRPSKYALHTWGSKACPDGLRDGGTSNAPTRPYDAVLF